MNSNTTRVVAGIAVVLIAIVLFAVLRDEDNGRSASEKAETATARTTNPAGNTVTEPEITTIVIKHGKPVGGIAELSYDRGEEVRFRVESDVSDEVHMHGYDIMKDVEAGGSVSFDFPATIEGIFEAELEDRREQILELTVNP